MNRTFIKALKLLTPVAMLSYYLGMPLLLSPVNAASLTDVTVALTNEATSATDNIVVTFTPVTAIEDTAVIEVNYDTGFTGGAALTDADVAVTGTNITSTVESDFAAGYFKSTLTTSANVTTLVTITIDGTNELTNPATSGNYSWSITVDTDGTATTYDNGAGLAYVADDNDVTVEATVPPVIDMELFIQNSDSELVDPNTCDLGVLSLTVVKSCVYDIGTATNNSTGLSVRIIADGDMDDGSGNTIDDTIGPVSAGTEGYGFVISDTGSGATAYTASGSFSNPDQAVPQTTVTFATIGVNHDYVAGGSSTEHLEVTHKASMDASTVVGNYDQEVTYTAFTN